MTAVAAKQGGPPSGRWVRTEGALYRHRVCPAEVDGFNVVHFSNYMRWVSAAMIDLFEASGLGPGRFCDGAVEIRVGRAQVAYVASARLGDEIVASVRSTAVESSSLVLGCAVHCGTRLLARGRLTVAFVDGATGALTATPDEVRRALQGGVP